MFNRPAGADRREGEDQRRYPMQKVCATIGRDHHGATLTCGL